ncbi:uncharacterized protein PV09_00330 [Verruconis gallopava]|uniref:UvrD-like helicase ATP-binding domain-containing protein n=1 Tax=Verruconis gallopava TaxID=253628 RepID=A0A0D2ASG7_9PEZI|nr:uncharacterized protein PV09_00330 [Verruconis gallopava]KIW09450.1 hypothetical protein PV09_00330 [Verruconis gallopava]
MADVTIAAINELKALPQGLHWFCSRSTDDEVDRCYDEDFTQNELQMENQDKRNERREKAEAASKRKRTVLSAVQIFAFDGEEAVPLQDYVRNGLEHLMQTCDVCVRTYHAARSELGEILMAEYHAEEVAAFMERFDGINVERIRKGLQHAERQLLHLAPEKRRVGSLDPEGLYALFEAMNCEPYLRNEQLMQETFDEPFRLVQTTKKLRLPTYLPAFTYFVFSDNMERLEWARYAWNKLSRPPTEHEFTYMIRKPLELALRRVQMSALEVGFLPAFWRGVSIVVPKLTGELVMNSLRPMEANIHRMCLDQFSLKEINVETFAYLVSTWKELIEKSPEAFWDTLRSIPPKAIIEQCFRSPALHEILVRPDTQGYPPLENVFSWIRPFMATIKGNPVAACGALAREFVSRSENDQLASEARSYCFTLALHVIQQTLQGMIRPPSFEAYVGSAVAAEMLEQVNEYLPLILQYTRGIKNGAKPSEDAAAALSIIESAVALDCLTLVQDRKAVQFHKPRGHTAPKRSDEFWNRLTNGISSSDQALATRVLIGARELVGLEKFSPKFSPRVADDPKQFAAAFDAKCSQLSNFLGRVSDFPTFQLAGLFKTEETAQGIVHILFSSDVNVRQGAVEILKAMSEKTGRDDAIAYTLDNAFYTFLKAFTVSMTDICGKVIFTPMPGMIKLCNDVVDVLCNPSNGILRMKDLVEQECDAVKAFWKALWSVLTTIFQNMEGWGTQGHDKQFMMDFCRDTMQFADTLFDHYSVFLNAIRDDYEDEQQNREQAKDLLQHPRDSMNTMVRWLRLRDEFLIEKILTLVTSLLARLSKSKVDATEASLDYIEDVAAKKIRTNLKELQLAQLREAIDKYSDRRIAQRVVEEKKKVVKQTSLNAWATSGRTKDDAIDLDSDLEAAQRKVITDATKAAERFKQLKEQREKKLPITKKQAIPPARKNVIDQSEFIRKRRLEEEEARKKKAALAAAARGSIPGPGSALNSVGVLAKDHSVKGEGVMVDSDESSSDSSDSDDDDENDLDRELFGPKRKTAKPANAMSEADAAKLLSKGPVKVRKVVRSAKDMRARLAPDLSKLHQEILSWDYFHNGYYPPNSRADAYQRVPESLQDPSMYKNIFQPLLVLETWRKICNDKDQEAQNRPYEIKIISRALVDAFVEVSCSIPRAPEQERLEVSEGDLVLLSKARDPTGSPDSPSCLSRIHKVTRKKAHVEVLYRVVPGNKFMSSINGGVTVWAMKVDSLITVEREYGALMGLQYYDLCDYILQATPSRLLTYGETALKPLMDNYKLNQAQAKAVKSALDNDAFTLIQGPPGSGKTKTIIATVGALLTDALKDRSTAVTRPGMANGAAPVRTTSKKLLVCAPSNAAVDELVLRFKEGIKLSSGQEKKINVVRLGRSEKINPQVLEVTLEELVTARLNKAAGFSENQRMETKKLMDEHQDVSRKLNEAYDKRDSAAGKGANASAIEEEINMYRRRKKELSLLIDQAKDKEQNTVRQNDLEKKRIEQQILDEAHILCATLSASGHERFQNLSLEFETVIVDEAAQCTELQALIPLKYGCSKCILVGDPKQLPPTTFMDAKLNFQYEQSLFVRMQNNSPEDVHLLDTQYRMHPEISLFPSKCFYDSRLLDGPEMAKLRAKPWHKDPILGPYRFFDVQGQQSSGPRGSSLTNRMEIDAAMRLYEKLLATCSTYDFRGKIGIITPYKAQFNALKQRFQEEYGKGIVDTIEFNTTDAFQGRECEIIIFSCVRASEGSIGFLNDYRRMNVGLTRAKCSLWVLGNTRSLVNGKDWRAMIEDAQARQRISPAKDIDLGQSITAAGSYRPIQTPISSLTCDDGDVKMGGYSGVNSSDASRRSSISSASVNSKSFPTVPGKDRIKTEFSRRVKEEASDLDVKVALSSDSEDNKSSVTSESYIKKELNDGHQMGKQQQTNHISAPGPPSRASSGAAPGFLVPRPSGQMPVKRKKPQANPLLDSKRPKKK